MSSKSRSTGMALLLLLAAVFLGAGLSLLIEPVRDRVLYTRHDMVTPVDVEVLGESYVLIKRYEWLPGEDVVTVTRDPDGKSTRRQAMPTGGFDLEAMREFIDQFSAQGAASQPPPEISDGVLLDR